MSTQEALVDRNQFLREGTPVVDGRAAETIRIALGTFEVTRGRGTRAEFGAFVMDKSGAVIARDTQSVKAAVPGLLVDFRFRRTACARIDDWQMQVTTPKVPSK